MDFLVATQNRLKDHLRSGQLAIRTEHKRDGIIFRGHPNYRQKGQWNDWALFNWGDDGCAPAEIWCYLDLRELPKRGIHVHWGGCQVKGAVYAVVEHAYWPDDANQRSDMFMRYRKDVRENDHGPPDRIFYLADVEAIEEPLCVVPDVGCVGGRDYFVVKPRGKWSNDFISWVEADHRYDDMRDMML